MKKDDKIICYQTQYNGIEIMPKRFEIGGYTLFEHIINIYQLIIVIVFMLFMINALTELAKILSMW